MLTIFIVRSILIVVRHSERIILIQLKSQNGKINRIKIYAPTAHKSNQELEGFYSDVNIVLRLTKKGVTTIIIGDSSAKLGKGKA